MKNLESSKISFTRAITISWELFPEELDRYDHNREEFRGICKRYLHPSKEELLKLVQKYFIIDCELFIFNSPVLSRNPIVSEIKYLEHAIKHLNAEIISILSPENVT